MSTMTNRLLSVLIAVVVMAAAHAQHPNINRGFDPDKVFHFGGIDSVNLYNGNLNVAVPLGQEYVGNGSLRYRFMLSYNSKNWDYEIQYFTTWCDGFHFQDWCGKPYKKAVPSYRSNAGMGWLFSLGRLNPPTNPYDTNYGIIYETPSGTDHAFSEVDASDPAVSYTTDGSFLRLKWFYDEAKYELYFPDGMIHTFRHYPALQAQLLTEIRDPFNNRLKVTYTETKWTLEEYTSDDTLVRTHYVWIKDTTTDPTLKPQFAPVNYNHVVEMVDLAAYDGTPVPSGAAEGRARYRLNYSGDTVKYACYGDYRGSAEVTETPDPKVPRLTSVTLPDESTWNMDYHEFSGDGSFCAALKTLTLPTRGQLSWTYGSYSIPTEGCDDSFSQVSIFVAPYAQSEGVATKTATDTVNDISDRWTYTQSSDDELTTYTNCWNNALIAKPRWSTTTVVRPDGNKSEHYFSLMPWNSSLYGEHGLPFTRKEGLRGGSVVTPADGATDLCLSSIEYDCSSGTCEKTQSHYVRYVGERREHIFEQVQIPQHRREVESRTVFHDQEGDSYVATIRKGYDGLGNFRRTETTDGFWTPTTRIQETNFNPGKPEIAVDAATWVSTVVGGDAGAKPEDNRPAPGAPWLLSLYDYRTVQQGDSIVRSEFLFDPVYGFLHRRRDLRKGLSEPPQRDAHDTVTVFTVTDGNGPIDNGNLVEESFYGGDGPGRELPPSSLSASPAVALESLSFNDPPEYRIHHSYSHGTRNRSAYLNSDGTEFLRILDAEIDSNTGLPSKSVDSAGVETLYDYDPMGRLKFVKPDGRAATTYDYVPAGASPSTSPASVVIRHCSEGVTLCPTTSLAQTVYYYDGLGRILQERRQFDATNWATTWTSYAPMGQKSSVTVPVFQNSMAFVENPPAGTEQTSWLYDSYGRVTRETRPDGTSSTFHFFGRRKTERFSGAQLRSTEEHDSAGRLLEVLQNPTGSTSDAITTTYAYDAGDRLTSVTMTGKGGDGLQAVQNRLFEYDARGFLRKEEHPESAPIYYSGYDARGHATLRSLHRVEPDGDPGARTITRHDLQFTFDAAERLTTVHSWPSPTESAQDLKRFTFATDNLVSDNTTNYAKGRLLTAVRRNELPSGATVDVTETYSYGKAGPVSSRSTLVEEIVKEGGTETRRPIQTFEHTIEYDPLLAISKTGMPTCPHGCASSGFLSNVDYQRNKAGLLTSVVGFAALTPHPTGMVETVHHASSPSVTDTYEADSGMARPKSIRFDVPAPPSCSSPESAITVTRPQGTTVRPGESVTLSVLASSGLLPLSYQWFRGTRESGTPVAVTEVTTDPNFTSPALTATVVYWVRVTNPCHAVDSDYAEIEVDTCLFTLEGSGPGDSAFKDAASVEASDYVVARGTSPTLRVQAVLADGQPVTADAYLWTDGAVTSTGPSYDVADVQGARRVTAQVTGPAADGSCTRTMEFNLNVCDTSLVVRAGACLVSDEPEAYVRLGTTVSLQAEVMLAEGDSLQDLPSEELDQVRFIWTDDDGNVLFDVRGSAGRMQTYQVPSNGGDVPDHLLLTVVQLNGAVAACTRTIRMKLHVLDEPACDPDTESSCRGVCIVGPIRVNDVARHSYSFTTGEQVILKPPLALPADTTDLEWHRVRNGVDEIVGREYEHHRTMHSPVQLYVRGTAGGVLYSSTRLDARLSVASAGVTVTPAYQEIQAGTAASVTVAVEGFTPLAYEWRIGGKYDTSRTVISHGSTLTLTLHHDTLVWCRVKAGENDWRLSPVAEILTRCTPSVSGHAGPHPRFVARDGYSFIGSAVHGKIEAMYWYERNEDFTKTYLTSGMSSAINYYPRKAATTLGADLVDTCGTTGELNETTVYMCVPTVTQQPQSVIVPAGTSATLTAAATPAVDGQPIEIFWYDAADQYHVNPLVATPSPSFTTPPIPAGTTKSYVAAFTVQCTSGQQYVHESAVAVVETCVPPTVAVPAIEILSASPGSAVTISVQPAGEDLTFQWFEGASGDTSRPWASRTDSSAMFAPATTTSYWCRVTSRGVCVTDSDAITIRICPLFHSAPVAANTIVMPGTTTTLSVEVDRGDTMEWYSSVGGAAPVKFAEGGAELATVTTPPITEPTTFFARAISGECSKDSEPITIQVCSSPTVHWSSGNPTQVARGAQFFLTTGLAPGETANFKWYRGTTSGDVAGSTLVYQSSGAFQLTLQESASFWVRAWDESTGCTSDTTVHAVEVCIPTIVTHPQPAAITAGASTTLGVATDIAAAGYQWYVGESGDVSSPVAGATGAQVTVSPIVDTRYWVRVIGCGSRQIDSAAALVSVCTPPTVVSHTPSVWITKGATRQLNVEGQGTDVTYRWYRGQSGDTTNSIGNSFSVFVTPADTTSYWARVSNGCGSDDTETIVVSVCATPVITTQPASVSIFSGATATLSVTATQATSTAMTYQWYSGSGTSNPIGGATSSTYVTPSLTAPTTYWVRVTAGTCSVDSAPATVSMCVYSPTLNAPDDRDIAIGQTTRLNVNLSPVPQQYRWYRGAQGDKTNLISSISYVDVSPAVTTQYWGELTHDGCTAKTRTVTVWVSIPTITQQPAANTQVNAGQSATLTVAANTTGLTYQWYSGTSGSGTPISGATGSTYVTPALAGGSSASYWVKVTGSRGHAVNSSTASVTWCAPATISQHPQSYSIRRGTSASLLVNATGTNLRYQWYRATSPSETNAVGGATSPNFSVSLPQDSVSYWVKVTSDCGVANSTTARIDVCDDPIINTQPASPVINTGSTATLTVTATSQTSMPLSYQWYTGTSGSGTAIPGATGATYTTPALSAPASYWVKVMSGICSTNSTTSTVSICPYPATVNQPADRNVRSGVATLLKVTLNPTPETYKWYRGAVGNRSTPLSYQPAFNVYPTVTTQYWGEFTYAGCVTQSRQVTINVCVPTITQQPQSQTIPYGSTATFSVTATEASTYQWYRGTYPSLIPGATAASYTTPALYANDDYWVEVTGTCGISTRSNYVDLVIQ